MKIKHIKILKLIIIWKKINFVNKKMKILIINNKMNQFITYSFLNKKLENP